MPYGKIHESFFSSSIVETDLETRFVFIAMIVLSDQNGRLDITRQALARRINTPLPIVDRAIEVLSAPDEMSRSPEHDGRRILPIDSARSWGWMVVNKTTYRHSSDDEKREQARQRKRRQRERERSGSHTSSSFSDANADTDTDTDTDSHTRHAVSRKTRDRTKRTYSEGSREMRFARLFVDLHEKAGSRLSSPKLQQWASRFDEVFRIDGRKEDEVEAVLRYVISDDNQRKYLMSPGALRASWADGSRKFDGWAERVRTRHASNKRVGGGTNAFDDFDIRSN